MKPVPVRTPSPSQTRVLPLEKRGRKLERGKFEPLNQVVKWMSETQGPEDLEGLNGKHKVEKVVNSNNMKNPIKGLNKIFDSRIRLGIMSVLVVTETMDFNSLKDLLEVTDGNLASHMKSLEKEEYVTVQKRFVGRKPKTNYRASATGKKAFEKHLDSLEKLTNS